MYKHTQVFGLSRDFAHAISPWVCNNFLFFTRSNGLSFMDWCTWKLRYVIPSWELPTPQMILASAWDQELPHSNSSHKDCCFKFGIGVAIERQKLYNGMDIVESELRYVYVKSWTCQLLNLNLECRLCLSTWSNSLEEVSRGNAFIKCRITQT